MPRWGRNADEGPTPTKDHCDDSCEHRTRTRSRNPAETQPAHRRLPAFVLNVIAGFAVFVSWFAALATGRMPTWAWTFVARVTEYQARVSAYQCLLVDEYPPFAFSSPDVTNYPVQLDLPEQGRLSRIKVLFRLILAIPAIIVITALNWGWTARAGSSSGSRC